MSTFELRHRKRQGDQRRHEPYREYSDCYPTNCPVVFFDQTLSLTRDGGGGRQSDIQNEISNREQDDRPDDQPEHLAVNKRSRGTSFPERLFRNLCGRRCWEHDAAGTAGRNGGGNTQYVSAMWA